MDLNRTLFNIIKLLDITSFFQQKGIPIEIRLDDTFLKQKKEIEWVIYFLYFKLNSEDLEKNVGKCPNSELKQTNINNKYYFECLFSLKKENKWPSFIPIRFSYFSDYRNERFLWILVGLGYTVLKQELDKILIEDNKSIEDIEKLDINEIKTKTTQNTLEMLAQIKEHDNLVTEYKIQAKDLTQQIKSIESKINKNKAILASYEDKEAPINKQEIFNCLDSFSESYKNNMIPMTQLEQLINSNGELLIDGGELSKEKKNDMNINEIVKDIMNDMKEWMNQMDKINMESFDNEGDLEKMVNEHREYTKELKRIEKELKHQVDIMEFECKEESVDSKPNENTLFLNKLYNLYNKREGEFNHLQFDMDEIKNEMTGNKNSKKIKVNEFKMSPPSPPFKSLENMNLEFDPFDWL